MTFCHYQDALSPHVMPFMRALVARLGEDEVRYVYTQDMGLARRGLGWNDNEKPKWTLDSRQQPQEAQEWLETCPCLLSGCRDFNLFERRAKRSLVTFYSGERWFKPIFLFNGHVRIPGSLRLFLPRYLRMAYRLRRLLCGKAQFYYHGNGLFAVRDMVQLMNWLRGDFRPLHITCQRMPMGRVQDRGRGLDRIRLTGYFVAPSKGQRNQSCGQQDMTLKILWVGRLLDWKCVDTIMRAICAHADISRQNGKMPSMVLDVYGSGPMEESLKRLIIGNEQHVFFHPPVQIDEVRSLMQQHDVYVLASNAREGWGAVTNEALEEGMYVLGTYEAGSSATMLTDDALFHAGDWKRLLALLETCLGRKQRGELKGQGIGEWSVEKGVDHFVNFIAEVRELHDERGTSTN